MWSPGYPVLVALIRAMFPSTAEGEWHSINLLNWLIFLMAYGSWRYLIRKAIEFYEPSLAGLQDRPIFLWTTACAFLSCALCLDRVSSVCPDLLVTTLFILAVAQVLSLLNRPTAIRATALGIVLGAGCWVKGVFLSFGLAFFLILLWQCYRRKLPVRPMTISFFVFLVIFVPYVAGISMSYGQLTFGVSGVLNYAFHVNHMPHWTNWQGGPTAFGAPLHSTRQLISDLPVFEFGTPFRTTYPPYNNMAYWYRGFGNFYSLKLHIIAIGRNCYFLAAIVKRNPFLLTLVLSLLVVMLKREWRISLCTRTKRFWVLFAPALFGFAIYLSVHIEDRYISAFCLIFSLLPLLPLLDRALTSRRVLTVCLLMICTAGTATELAVIHESTFSAAIHGVDFHQDPQWKLAAALPLYGLHRDGAIALVDEGHPAYRCHWAYVSDLRIVAEFGSLPWTTEPWDRTRFDRPGTGAADEDYSLVFWKKLTPQRRAQVIGAFQVAGAQAVLALSGPDRPEPGWDEIVGTDAWIYRFQPDNQAVARQR
jgi:hypothetical protein